MGIPISFPFWLPRRKTAGFLPSAMTQGNWKKGQNVTSKEQHSCCLVLMRSYHFRLWHAYNEKVKQHHCCFILL